MPFIDCPAGVGGLEHDHARVDRCLSVRSSLDATCLAVGLHRRGEE
jgi:hypothetical protein